MLIYQDVLDEQEAERQRVLEAERLVREAERQRLLELQRQQQEAIKQQVLISVFFRYYRRFTHLQREADERAATEAKAKAAAEVRIMEQVHPIAQLHAAVRCLHMCTCFFVLPILQKFHDFAERG